MIALETIVQIPRSAWTIEQGTPMLLLGSCFSDEIGVKLRTHGFEAVSNPVGTLYNPLSIAQAMHFREPLMVEHDGLWHSMYHHSVFSGEDYDETRERCRQASQTLVKSLESAEYIMITFGTAYIYAYRGEVVANCHKLPEQEFVRRRIDVDEIIRAWSPLIEQYADKKWIFTVSPIRHYRDGLHANQISKATLLLAVEQLCQTFANTEYFPAYEILNDQLRDYRFYADDLCHPSSVAVEIIWERFSETYMTPATMDYAHKQYKQYLRTQHHQTIRTGRTGLTK